MHYWSENFENFSRLFIIAQSRKPATTPLGNCKTTGSYKGSLIDNKSQPNDESSNLGR